MTTTSQDLETFATKCVSTLVWTPALQGELMDLIREPAMTLLDQTIPPNDLTKAMDNIYRCKPRGWVRAEQELMPKADGTHQAVASFAFWTVSPPLTYQGLTSEIGCPAPCATLALAMICATARVWALLLRQAGR